MSDLTIDEVISVQRQIAQANGDMITVEDIQRFKALATSWTPPSNRLAWSACLYENGNFAPQKGTLRQVLNPFVYGHIRLHGCQAVIEGFFINNDITPFLCSDCGAVIVYLKRNITGDK